MQKQIRTAFVLLGALTVSSTLWSQTVTNGSFESPGHGAIWQTGAGGANYYVPASSSDFARNYVSIDYELPAGSKYLTGWTVGGGGIYYFVRNLPRSEIATDGSYALGLGIATTGGSISQTVTKLTPGTKYYVFFDLVVPEISEAARLTIKFGTQTRSVLNAKFGVWQTHQVEFTASATSQDLTFSMPASTVESTQFDNVRISDLPNAAVQLEAKKVIGVKVEGIIGKSYRVEYHSDANRNDDYVLFQRVTLNATPTWIYDLTASDSQQRFYRSVEE
jgi:hypothetical protein